MLRVSRRLIGSIQRPFSNQPWKRTLHEKMPDMGITLHKYDHSTLGLAHYHLESADPNNVFAIIIKAGQDREQGKYMVLERLLMGGSQKYPGRDNLQKGGFEEQPQSWVGTDCIVFPVQSPIQSELKSLRSILADSVFNPNLRDIDFLIDGYRLELTNPQDIQSPLTPRGYIFSEARNIRTDPDALFLDILYNNLYASTPLAVSIAPAPSSLLGLSSSTLTDLHAKCTHPSNLTLYSYGNIPPEEHQNFLNSNYLIGLPQAQSKEPEKNQPQSTNSKKRVQGKMAPSTNAAGTADMASTVAIIYPCQPLHSNPEEQLCLSVLSTLLFDQPDSPLFGLLLQPGKARGYSPGYGYEANGTITYMNIGAKGVPPGKEEDTLLAIKQTLQKLATEGLGDSLKQLEEIFNQIELQAKLNTGRQGMKILQSYFGTMVHKADNTLIAGLKLRQLLQNLRKRLHSGEKVFENLISKYLVNNPKSFEILLLADEQYLEDVETDIENKVKEIERGLLIEDREKILKQMYEVEEEMKKVDITAVTRLTIDDVLKVEKEEGEKRGYVTLWNMAGGVTRVGVKISLQGLQPDEIKRVGVISKLLPRMGTPSVPFFSLHNLSIQSHLSTENHPETGVPQPFLFLSLSSLDQNMENLFALLMSVLAHPDFSNLEHLSRLMKILSSESASYIQANPTLCLLEQLQSSISSTTPPMPNTFSINRQVCTSAAELLKGIDIRKTLGLLESGLSTTYKSMMRRSNIEFSVHSDPKNFSQIMTRIEVVMSALKSTFRGTFM